MPVLCAECDEPIDDLSDTVAEEREPCPNCGSTARQYIESGVGEFRLTGSAAVVVEKAIARGYTFDLLNPTDADGSWTAMAREYGGDAFPIGEASNRNDAILEIVKWARDNVSDDNGGNST